MGYTVQEIATALGVQAFGAVDLFVSGIAEPQDATADQIALAMKPEYAARIDEGAARVAMLWDGANWEKLGVEAAIMSPRPRFALAGLSTMMDPYWPRTPGIHPTALIDPSADIGEGAEIGPFVVIGANVKIGPRAKLATHVSIDRDTTIGSDALVRAGTRIGYNVVIGDRFVCLSNTAIGSDGFSFVSPEQSTIERVRDNLGDIGDLTQQGFVRIHSLGSVVIGDDVEIGANTCIDRGSIRATQIGNGCKIDNLVQIGHNVVLGTNCLLCAQVAIAGSTVVGNSAVFGGQAGVGDNLKIGDNAIIGAGSGILSNVPSGRVMLGYPATKMDSQLESYKAVRRLPRVMRDIAALKKAVFKSGQSD